MQKQPANFTHQAEFISQLNDAKLRVEALNRLRIQRALAANEDNFKHVFLLLPLLLHYNHPTLPAYIENAPAGFVQFSAKPFQRAFLQQNAPSNLAENLQADFEALYVMGSVGSISQTPQSDLDLWLCCKPHLLPQQYRLLEQKLAKLTLWAKSHQVDIHFYLMNPEDFKQRWLHNITAEHSGSAQHYTLLEEFYRSAIRLAGKRLLWWHIADNGDDYTQQVLKAVDNGLLNPNDWLDFGDISALSVDEYFGATLWQLYKGIVSPYKSALKILLLESYAQTYPHTDFIAQQFKRMLLGKKRHYHFDPYLAMLEQASQYLVSRNEFNRLNLLRCSFYIKAYNGVKKGSWRESKLQQLTQQWQWSDTDIAVLNQHRTWKIKQAAIQQKLITEQLILSYRHLIQFARRMHLNPSILSSDTDLLMRQLYSAFEILPDKVTLINPQVSENLAEQNVTFIEVRNSIATKNGWYLINQSPKSPYNSTTRYVGYEKNLNKLAAWAYFNGIVTADTQIHLVSSQVELATLRQFITDLRLSFTVEAPQLSHYDLHHPKEIRSLSVVINLENDPTRHLSIWQRDISLKSLLNLNNDEANLIGSISIIYRNLWNEIRTQHFEGSTALLKALKLISNKICRNAAPPRVVNVHCYSANLRSELRDLIAGLVNKCINVQTSTIFQKQQLSEYKLHTHQRSGFFQALLENDDEIAKSAIHTTFPREIDEFASEGFLQFFFEDNADESFNVYILDEQNHIETYHNCHGSKEEKVKQIYKSHAIKLHKQDSNRESFNFPQFYQLLKLAEKIEIVPFQSKQHREYSQSSVNCK